MSERETIISKLRKIEGMLQSPFENERNVAKALLEELCRKHGVSRADLLGEQLKEFKFQAVDENEIKLLAHVIWLVTGGMDHAIHTKGKFIHVKLGIPHGIDVEECYFHYKNELKEYLDNAILAFIHKNGIKGPATGNTPKNDSPEFQEKIRRIRRMMEGVDSNKWDGVKRLS